MNQNNHQHNAAPTGYAPSASMKNRVHRSRPIFNGNESNFEIFEVKFLSYLRLCGLYEVTQNPDSENDVELNAEVFAELIQCLDDRSINLIIRDARDNGRKSLEILSLHYRPKGKARVITLYTELTSLQKNDIETVTDYVVRAEIITAALREADETISDGLLIAMILKGLPHTFLPFSVMVNDKAQLSFAEFKKALRNFEDNQNLNRTNEKNNVMGLNVQNQDYQNNNQSKSKWCSKCKSNTHDTKQCKRWCHFHKNDSHWTKDCRSKNKNKYHHQAKFADQSFETANRHQREPLHSEPSSFAPQRDQDPSYQTKSFFFMVNSQTTNDIKRESSSPQILVDSGATVHILNDKRYFESFNQNFNSKNHVIELANGTKIEGNAQAQGNAKITIYDSNNQAHSVQLLNTLYIPNFKHNIFSVSAATKHGANISFNKYSGQMVKNDCVFKFEKVNNLYFLNSINHCKKEIDSIKACRSLEEWHKIMGHCNTKDILKLEKCTQNMKITNKNSFDCETCIKGKMTITRNRKPDDRAKSTLEFVHLDLEGPIEPASKEGYRWILGCTDDYSGIIRPYFMRNKSDTLEAFKMFIADTRPYGNIKRVRLDNGGEFISNAFKNYLRENKIKPEFSAPHSPHQNGTAERTWRTLLDMSRCLIIDSKLPKTFWPYAVMYSAHIRNICFNNRTQCTPYETLTGKLPDMNLIHQFGATCFTYVQKAKKLEEKAQKGMFLGYDKYSPSYLVYLPEQNIIKTRNVKFFKDVSHSDTNDIQNLRFFNDVSHDDTNDNTSVEEDFDFIAMKGQGAPQNTESDLGFQNNSFSNENNHIEPTTQSEGESESNDIGNNNHLRKGERTKIRPKYLDDYINVVNNDNSDKINVLHYVYGVNLELPNTYEQAIKSKNASEWEGAMATEMGALKENNTFELTNLPPGRKAIGGKWVYTVKTGVDDNQIFKARYVAKGFSQMPELEYSETFSPTAKMTSVRLLIQLAIENDMKIDQMDVKSAYLNAPIDKEIFVEQAKGFEKFDQNGEKLVYKLNKSLYGLKQSGRNWNQTLNNYLMSLGFHQSQNDPCLYIKTSDKGMVILLTFVDDMLLVSSNQIEKNKIKANLKERFRMKDLGNISKFLGIDFSVTDNFISMSQCKYIEKLLTVFGMENCKPKNTPSEMDVNKQNNEPLDESQHKIYRQIVGGLIYIMCSTRPDLAFIVTILSQHMSNPSEGDLVMAKHVLRYLKGTKDWILVFRKSGAQISINGCCDSDWANSEDRKSISGYCFNIFVNGPLISWKTRKQPTVALSTCEAEYISLVSAIQEGKYLKSLIYEITGLNLNCQMNCDNQGTIALAKNPIKQQRTKHVDIKYHFIRDEIHKGSVSMSYIPSEENLADIFTKPISSNKLRRFKNDIFGV